ncbi:MAG: hypothetical protein LBC92_05500 [Rickettsiales bacterium]|jgi:hypothetical protein|nr:hypothetical protein [Rickettsiales bacterium]
MITIKMKLKNKKNVKIKQEQLDMLDMNEKNYSFIPRLDKKFSYKFKDLNGKESTLQIEDWEIGELYLKYLKTKDVSKVKDKLENFIKNNDLYFFLGTQNKFDGRSKNPFIIVGIFYPLKTKQTNDLFSFINLQS